MRIFVAVARQGEVMKRNTLQTCASVLGAITVVALSGSAHAQDAAPQPAPATQPQAGASAQASASGAMTLPGATPAAAPAPAAQAAPGDSDHDQMVGTLAIGLLGSRTMAVGCDPAGCPGGVTGPSGQPVPSNAQNLSTPVVGIRYWMNGLLGIDAGLGLLIAGQGQKTTAGTGAAQVTNPQPSTFGLLLHGGVPLALKSTGHFTFELIPEMNIGFSSWSVNGGGIDLTGSGFHFDLGGRAGAEIHFGFIGIPQLSLLGTIGVLFSTDALSNENKTSGAKTSSTLTSFGTTVQNSPWDIFTSNVAAFYYF
jgi:hypothetical protein